jgi:hypothetical protein
MKFPRKIFLLLSTVAACLSTVAYKSCKKDPCNKVVCQNGGACKEGNCSCPTGIVGKHCETTYRSTYANTDTGSVYFSTGSYLHGFRLTFGVSSPDLTKMDVITATSSGVEGWHFTITLSNFTANGASFTVVPFVYDNYTYTGDGTISATGASLILNESGGRVYTFANFKKM